MGKIVLVGGAGFIGRNLAKELTEHGKEVRIADRAWTDGSVDAEFAECDFISGEGIPAALENAEAVVHLASTTIPKSSNDDPLFDIRTNLEGSISLLDSALRAGVSRFIYVSSGGTVYGPVVKMPIREDHPTNPICSYGIVKLAVEKYVRLYSSLYGLRGCSVRPSNPYGPFQKPDTGQGAIAAFCSKAIKGEPIEVWGDGKVTRDFVYIQDVVRAILLTIEDPSIEGEINIGSGKSASLLEVIKTIEDKLGRSIDVVFKDARHFDVHDTRLDISRARRELGWEPVIGLGDGISKTLDWLSASMH